MLPIQFPFFHTFTFFFCWFSRSIVCCQLPAKRLEREGFFHLVNWAASFKLRVLPWAMATRIYRHHAPGAKDCDSSEKVCLHVWGFFYFLFLSKCALAPVEEGPFCVDACASKSRLYRVIRCNRCIHYRFNDSRNMYLKKRRP